jgi:hypothetical protein
LRWRRKKAPVRIAIALLLVHDPEKGMRVKFFPKRLPKTNAKTPQSDEAQSKPPLRRKSRRASIDLGQLIILD